MLYAAWVNTGHESETASLLSQLKGVIPLPVARTVVYEYGSKEEVIFPGYVLMKIKDFTTDMWHAIKNVQYVIRPLGSLTVDEEEQLLQSLAQPEADISLIQAGVLARAMEEVAAAAEKPAANNNALTLAQIKDIVAKVKSAVTNPFIIGKKYRIRLPWKTVKLIRSLGEWASVLPFLEE